MQQYQEAGAEVWKNLYLTLTWLWSTGAGKAKMTFKCYRDKRQPSALFDSEMLQKYENHLREEGLKESTILSRKYAVSHFLKYQSEQEAGLSDQFVIKYLDHLQNSPFSPATKGLYLSSIKKISGIPFFQAGNFRPPCTGCFPGTLSQNM